MSEARADDVWVPGDLVDLEALKRQYDTVIFTRIAVSCIEGAMSRVVSMLESPSLDDGEGCAAVEAALDEAHKVLAKLREVL